MSRITAGDRRAFGPPSTSHGSCTVDDSGEVTAVRWDWTCYHRTGAPYTGPVYVLGRTAGGEDLVATEVRDLNDLEKAIERSGRVEPAPEPVEAEPIGEVVRDR